MNKKYIPFTFESGRALLGSTVTHVTSNSDHLVVGASRNQINIGGDWIYYEVFLKDYSFGNGNPCGVENKIDWNTLLKKYPDGVPVVVNNRDNNNKEKRYLWGLLCGCFRCYDSGKTKLTSESSELLISWEQCVPFYKVDGGEHDK